MLRLHWRLRSSSCAVLCQQRTACCAALRTSTAHPAAHYISSLRTPVQVLTCIMGTTYATNTLYMHIHTHKHANSQICLIVHSADAVQAARNSASGWSRTSSSCLCSCAPLHQASSQPCHAMLQSVRQTTHIQCSQDHMQSIHATLLQVPHATTQMLLLPSQLARHLALELG